MGVCILAGAKFCLFSNTSRPAVGPKKSPIECAPQYFPRRQIYWAVKLTNHLLSPSSRMGGSIPLLPFNAFTTSAGRSLFYFFKFFPFLVIRCHLFQYIIMCSHRFLLVLRLDCHEFRDTQYNSYRECHTFI